MKQSKGKLVGTTVLIIWLSLLYIPSISATSLQLVKDFPVSSGSYFHQFSTDDPNRLNVMSIDLTDPYTEVALSYPSQFNKLETTTQQALNYHVPERTAVGAVNGAFYHIGNKEPIGLISEYNRLVNMGYFSADPNKYVNKPIAFGVNTEGKGIIDNYSIDLSYTREHQTFSITSMNKERDPDQLILFTDRYKYRTTNTNTYGMEVVVETASDVELSYGESYQGVVTAVREYGEVTPTHIPEHGFVLSGNGLSYHQLKEIELGDEIEVKASIDQKWQQAEFMLASGPQLVKDGKVAITMNTGSNRAKEIAPRSAVAIDQSGNRVFFVTVDGRQSKYSKGMNLVQFAEHLVELGADRAINLDGGGSTTMAVRKTGDPLISLFNRPSDGRERGVSSVLLALTTEPAHYSLYYKDVKPGASHYESIRWLSAQGIKGYEDASFRPNTALSRMHASIMFTKVLNLSMTQVAGDLTIFDDVETTHVYAPYIATMKAHHIFGGSNGSFFPNSQLTREQMASTLVRAFQLTPKEPHVTINLSNVSETHKENVQILADLAITSQVNDFRPKEPVTRAQFATFLYNTQVHLNKQ